MDLVDFGRRNVVSQRSASHMPLSPTPAPDSGDQPVLSQYHLHILIPQSAFKHTSQSLNHYKDRREHSSHMHALIAWKWRGRGKHWVSSTLLFTLMLVWVMYTLSKGQHFFGRQMKEGTSSLEKRDNVTSVQHLRTLLPWPSGSHRSVSSRICDWSFKNKTEPVATFLRKSSHRRHGNVLSSL